MEDSWRLPRGTYCGEGLQSNGSEIIRSSYALRVPRSGSCRDDSGVI